MTTVIVAGLGQAPGKTAVAAALAQRWRSAGRSLGYVRVTASEPSDAAGSDPDVEFVTGSLGIRGEAVPFGGAPGIPAPLVDDAVQRFRDAGVLLLEVASGVHQGNLIHALPGYAGARVVLVAGYQQGLNGPAIVQAAAGVPAGLVGVVVNGVPSRYLPIFREDLRMDGLPLLGVIPESRALMGFTIAELAHHLGAEVLGAQDGRDQVIQHLMMGANIVDTATAYFIQQEQTAVFCKVDRPDLQLAALNQSARCLVLAGIGVPQQSLLHRAQDLGVPVLRVLTDVLDTVALLDGLVEGARFRQAAKIPVAAALLKAHLDLAALESALGL